MARPKTRVKRIILGMFAIMQLSILMSGTGVRAADSNSDNIDDDLVVSFAASGVQNFPDSDAGETESISEINFSTSGNTFNYSTTNLTNGSTIQAKRLFGANANSYQNIGSGSGSISLGNAVVWGGAGGTGQYAIPRKVDQPVAGFLTSHQHSVTLACGGLLVTLITSFSYWMRMVMPYFLPFFQLLLSPLPCSTTRAAQHLHQLLHRFKTTQDLHIVVTQITTHT